MCASGTNEANAKQMQTKTSFEVLEIFIKSFGREVGHLRTCQRFEAEKLNNS